MFRNRKMEYPNGDIHNINIKKFGYNKKLDKYFIYYYDKENKDNEYTILNKTKNSYIVNPDDETEYETLVKNCKTIKINKLPSILKFNEKKEVKKEKQKKQKNKYFQKIKEYSIKIYNSIKNKEKKKKNNNKKKELKIYQTNNNEFYINSSFCQKEKIGNHNKTLSLDNVLCYQVTKEEINKLEKRRNLSIKYIKKTLLKYFRVFKTDDGYYASEKLCNTYHVGNKSNSQEIENITCLKITTEEIEKIEKKEPGFKASYKKITIDKSNKKEENKKILIKLYYDKNNNYYISEKVYKSLNLEAKKHININDEYYTMINEQELNIISSKLKNLDINFEYKKYEFIEEKEFNIRPNKEQKDQLIPGTNIYLPRNREILETDEEYEKFLERYYNKYVIKKEKTKDQKDGFIPGTHIYLPRDRGILETDEEYVSFLENYYNTYLGSIDEYNEKKFTK